MRLGRSRAVPALLAACLALVLAACAPETPFATCSSNADCVPEEYCSSGGLCRARALDAAADPFFDAEPADGADGADASDTVAADLADAADLDAAAPEVGPDAPLDVADAEIDPANDPDLADADCPDAAPRNACGGCGVLPANEAAPCGQCGDGLWTCTAAGTLECVGASRLNACGTCTELAGRPGAPCGCDAADTVWTCDPDTGAFVECLGPAPPNACGGCAALPETVGAVCRCGGEGAATWRCEGDDDVTCADGDDSALEPRAYSNHFDVFQHRAVGIPGPVEGHLDAPDDLDWYSTGQVTDVAFSNMVPRATLVAPSAEVDYELCLFYRLTHRAPARDLAANAYACGEASACAWLDASEVDGGDAGVRYLEGDGGACPAAAGSFDTSTDWYGCCSAPARPDDDTWRATLSGIQDPTMPWLEHHGVAQILVRATRNEAAEGCDGYTLRVSF